MDDDHEELEHIPWSELMAGDRPDNRRLVYLGAGVLAAVAVGMLLGRAVWSPGAPDPVVVVADTTAESTTSTTVPPQPQPTIAPPVVVTTLPADTTTVPTTTVPAEPVPLYSEADLRAVPDEAFMRAAIARAEWFVTDYFTADTGVQGVTDILAALPPGTELPPMPHEADVGVTYVEWARAFWVEPEGDGVYTVAVLYRSLAAPDADTYYRTRMRAVAIRVAVGTDGGTTVLDLPAALPIPAGPAVFPQYSDPVVPPQDVATAAVLAASVWGVDPAVVEATLESEGWRLVLTAADEIGSRWPVVVRVMVE